MDFDPLFAFNNSLVEIFDIQMRGGLCHGCSVEWLFACLTGQEWRPEKEVWRVVSHQRAYEISWREALEGLWGGENYRQYLHIARGPSQRFVSEPARRYRMAFGEEHLFSLSDLHTKVRALTAGSGIVIGMFGVDRQENWGHSVSVVCTNDGNLLFLDPNHGQSNWGSGFEDLAGQEIRDHLKLHYPAHHVRDVFVYKVG